MDRRKTNRGGTGWCVLLVVFAFLAMIAFAFLSSSDNNSSTQEFQQIEQEQEIQPIEQEPERVQVQTLRVREGEPIPPSGDILYVSEFRNRSNKGALIDQNGVSYGIECLNANHPQIADPTLGMEYRSNGDGTFTPVN